MKAVKKIEISVLHKRITPIVYAVQGDTGREIECTVVDWDIPAGVTARVWVVKPSKKVVYNDCRIVDKSTFVPLTNQTLAEPGGAICMIEFVSGEDVVSSFSFNLYVYESASGDGIPSENESTVLEGMFEELAQDAINTLNEAKAQAAAAKKSAQDTEKIKNDFTLTAQQAVADVNNAGQTQTQRVNTAGDTQVSRIQAEGTTQVQNVQATAAEIAADREQIHTNRDNVAQLQRNSAGAITRSAEGSFITLEDAADGMGFRQLEIPGMTEQRTTTGAQLLNLSDVENAISNGLTYSIKNGVVTASGTPTVEYASIVAKKIKLPPGNYYASGIDTTSGRLFLQMAITSANGNKTFYSNKGFTIDGTEQSIDFVIQIGSNITALSKCTLYPMLNAGTTALPWEPYTGNKPSPSPEYPQELRNVGVQREDGKYKVKVTACKNNLLDMTGAKGGTVAGITTTVNPDGTLTSNGTATGLQTNIWLLGGYSPVTTDNVLFTLKAGKTYYISDVMLFMGTDRTAQNKLFVDPAKYPEGFKVTGVRHAQIGSGTVLTNKVYYPRVILGDTDTGWEPYRGHTATITSDRPLTKWDKLTCQDGVWGWTYEGNIEVFDGSNDETWSLQTINANGIVNFQIYPSALINTDADNLCSHFIQQKSWIANVSTQGFFISNTAGKSTLYIRIPSTTASTVEAFKAWLAEHIITVQYQTDTETWVPLSPAEQAAMNALCAYSGTTHIWTDDPLQPVISLDYTVDTDGYIRDTVPAYRDVERFAITGEASGAMATCTDSADWPLLGVGMKGKCEQVTTTGKNLFGGKALADKIMEIAPDSTIDANNGTVKFSASSITDKILYDKFEPGKQYTIIFFGKNTNPEANFVNITVKYDDGTYYNLNFASKTEMSYAVYTTKNATVTSLVGTWGSQITELQYDKCGIFEGAIDLASWEPYTGGAPSPSPAYPQEVQETGTYNQETGMHEADMVMRGAQLFNPKTLTYKSYVNDVTGAIASNAGDVNASDYIPVTGYKYVKITTTTASKQWGAFYDSSKKYISGIISYKNPVPVPANASYMRLTVIDDAIDAFMVNAGEVALPWEPYQSDTLHLTADQPWRGIGDVHDEVCERDGVLGTWRRFAEDILDGSEDEKWVMADCSEPSHKRFCSNLIGTKTKPSASNADTEPLLCNAYKTFSANSTFFQKQGVSVGATGTFAIYDNTFSPTADLSGFKAHLAEYPITVVYQLKEPYFEPFPEDIQKQYRKLKSYAGTTHAWVDDPLQPEVSFKYVKDSKLVLGKLEDRLAALETAQAQTTAAFGYLPANIQAEMIENETNQLMDSI